MLVRELMTRDPVTVRAGTPLHAAVALLDERSITLLPVVTDGAHLRGVLSEADVIRDRIPPDARAHLIPARTIHEEPRTPSVGDVMSRRVVTVREDTDVAEAAELMTTTAVKSLPVVDDHGRLVGMLSRRDIVHALARTDEELQRDIGDLLRGVSTDWRVTVRDGVVSIAGPTDANGRALARSAASTVRGVVRVEID